MDLSLFEPETPDEQAENLWRIYPCKKGKAVAMPKLKRVMARVGYDTLRKAILDYTAECDELGRPYMYPATWLNREAWEDEPAPRRKKPAGDIVNSDAYRTYVPVEKNSPGEQLAVVRDLREAFAEVREALSREGDRV
jgi:hypothetical protein